MSKVLVLLTGSAIVFAMAYWATAQYMHQLIINAV